MRTQDKYKLHIENHTILTFVDLMKKVESTETTISNLRKEKQAKKDIMGSWNKQAPIKK